MGGLVPDLIAPGKRPFQAAWLFTDYNLDIDCPPGKLQACRTEIPRVAENIPSSQTPVTPFRARRPEDAIRRARIIKVAEESRWQSRSTEIRKTPCDEAPVG